MNHMIQSHHHCVLSQRKGGMGQEWVKKSTIKELSGSPVQWLPLAFYKSQLYIMQPGHQLLLIVREFKHTERERGRTLHRQPEPWERTSWYLNFYFSV